MLHSWHTVRCAGAGAHDGAHACQGRWVDGVVQARGGGRAPFDTRPQPPQPVPCTLPVNIPYLVPVRFRVVLPDPAPFPPCPPLPALTPSPAPPTPTTPAHNQQQYLYFVNKHAVTANDPRGDQGHNGACFMTFHRAFMIEFENAIRSVVPELPAIPYWDMSLDTRGGKYKITDPDYFFSPKWAGALGSAPHAANNSYSVVDGMLGGLRVSPYPWFKFKSTAYIFNGSATTGLMRSHTDANTNPYLTRYPAANVRASFKKDVSGGGAGEEQGQHSVGQRAVEARREGCRSMLGTEHIHRCRPGCVEATMQPRSVTGCWTSERVAMPGGDGSPGHAGVPYPACAAPAWLVVPHNTPEGFPKCPGVLCVLLCVPSAVAPPLRPSVCPAEHHVHEGQPVCDQSKAQRV